MSLNPMKFEPVLINQLIASGLSLVVAFGLPVSDDQRQAILQFAGVVIAIFLGGGLISRAMVWSPASVEREVTEAYYSGKEDGKDEERWFAAEERNAAVNA